MLPDPRAAYGCDHRILCENGRECMGIVARRIAYTVLFFARTWCNEDRCIEALYLHERHSGTNSHLRIGRLVLLVRCIGTPGARAIRKLARSPRAVSETLRRDELRARREILTPERFR